VLEDDQIFLHIQERLLEKAGDKPYAQACYLPTPADRYVMAFRQWVHELNADPFPHQPLPPEWSTDELMDRYHSHTQHCGSCRPALQRLQQVRQGALIVSAIAWSMIPLAIALIHPLALWAASLLAGIPLLAGALWLGLGTLEQKFYEGEPVPPRNLVK
jgi:hypothetical protein